MLKLKILRTMADISVTFKEALLLFLRRIVTFSLQFSEFRPMIKSEKANISLRLYVLVANRVEQPFRKK